MSFMCEKQTNRNNNGKVKKKPEVCITGFPLAKKSELIILALDSGFKVTPNVNKNPDFLVCGDNAGEVKKQKAIDRDAELIFGEEAFRDFITSTSHFE